MTARPAVALALLLTFPASTLAQTPQNRLDLKSIKVAGSEPERKPFSLSFGSATKRNEFQQAGAQLSCVESEARGRTDADQKPMHKGWFWGSVGVGAVVGIFGLAMPAVAAAVKPKPKMTPQNVDLACYAQGYGSKARHENALAGLWGSLVGVGVWALLAGVSSAFD